MEELQQAALCEALEAEERSCGWQAEASRQGGGVGSMV